MSDTYMPTNAEIIESLSKKLERVRILNDLNNCSTLEDLEALKKKYETLCQNDEN